MCCSLAARLLRVTEYGLFGEAGNKRRQETKSKHQITEAAASNTNKFRIVIGRNNCHITTSCWESLRLASRAILPCGTWKQVMVVNTRATWSHWKQCLRNVQMNCGWNLSRKRKVVIKIHTWKKLPASLTSPAEHIFGHPCAQLFQVSIWRIPCGGGFAAENLGKVSTVKSVH